MNKEEVYKEIEQSYKDSYKALCATAYRQLGSKENAEDAVQETYLRACIYWKAYDRDVGMYPWISGIFSNCMKDVKKSEVSHGAVNYSEEELGRFSSTPATAHKRVEADELIEFIQEQNASVKEVLRLNVVLGFTSKETAQMVPGNESYIRKIVQRFREEVREKYA